MNNKTKKKSFLIGFMILLAIVIIGFCCIYLHNEKQRKQSPQIESILETLDISKTSKLMIVAHPDDEMLWGGGHLLEGGYVVLCLTNGNQSTRSEEFNTIVEATGNIPIILQYPDKINFKRDDWSQSFDSISTDISYILSVQHWDFVVTHNPDGEYGHIHHKMTNTITTEAFLNHSSADQLYYFGTYYKASDIENAGAPTFSEDILKRKTELCEKYQSQHSTIQKLSHMLPYENWKEYQNEITP